jgi:hypothetical protein
MQPSRQSPYMEEIKVQLGPLLVFRRNELEEY